MRSIGPEAEVLHGPPVLSGSFRYFHRHMTTFRVCAITAREDWLSQGVATDGCVHMNIPHALT